MKITKEIYLVKRVNFDGKVEINVYDFEPASNLTLEHRTLEFDIDDSLVSDVDAAIIEELKIKQTELRAKAHSDSMRIQATIEELLALPVPNEED